AGLQSASFLLHNGEPAWGGEQHCGDQALGLEPEDRFAYDGKMGARIVNEDQALRIDLREEPANLLLAEAQKAVAEVEVNTAFSLGVQARLVAALNPFAKTRGLNAFLSLCEYGGVIFESDDAPKSVFP